MAGRFDKGKKELLELQPLELVPLGEFNTQGSLTGFILPNGSRMVSVKPVSGAVAAVFRDQLNAEIFIVKGTWTFVPDEETIQVYRKKG
jgi:hypothetical protein